MHLKSIQKILFLFLCLYASNIYTQDLKSFNLFGQADYFISGKITEGNAYVFTLFKSEDAINVIDGSSTVSFTLRPITKETFIQNLFTSYAAFKKKVNATDDQLPSAKNLIYNRPPTDPLELANYQELEAEATKLFYMFIAGSIVIEDLGNEPIAGTICYVDSLLILRRDVNDKSLQSRIKRLWRVYKSDEKLVKALLKTGQLDHSLDLGKEISTPTLKTLVAKLGQDTISGEFEFTKITAQLNRRKFMKEKETEFLQRRANDRHDQYEMAVNELNENAAALITNKDSLENYQIAFELIDSITYHETRRKNLNEEIAEADEKDRQMSKLLGVAEKVFMSYDTLDFDSGPAKERVATVRTKLLDFDEMIQSINCREPEGKEWSAEVNKQIRTWTAYFKQALEREKQSLATALDSTGIEYNIEIFQSIIGLYEDLPVVKTPLVCEYVKALEDLNQRQEDLINRIELQTLKTDIRSILLPRTDTVKLENMKTFVLTNRLQDSDNNIVELEAQLTIIHSAIELLEAKVAKLETNKSVGIRKIAEKEDQLIFKAFNVDSIVIEINEGFIENILMVGKVKEYTDKYGRLTMGPERKAVALPRTLKFENSSPIGFSRKLDFDAIKGKKLYTRGGGRTQYETFLEDVLSIYIQEHEVGRRDYSPANQKVVLKRGAKGQTNFCLGLKKEATYRLFEAKIFSDFVGLDDTEPNGLIQTEISKRINLLTSRSPFQFFSLEGLRNEWNLGFFSFLEPSLTLSKIENNNKFLTLDNKDRFINNQYSPIKFTSTLALKQFENFSAGATANLLLLDMPNIKSTFFVNWGFRYGRTGIQDSIRTAAPDGTVQVNDNGVNEFGVNTFDHAPELMWNIYADERYGFSMSWQHHWFYLRDNRFEQVGNTAFFADQATNSTKDSRQFNTFRFLTTLEQTSNNKGRLFFRYTYNWQQGFWRTGFHQAQVGYSFFLLGRKAE
jgi:hypothetical protein